MYVKCACQHKMKATGWLQCYSPGPVRLGFWDWKCKMDIVYCKREGLAINFHRIIECLPSICFLLSFLLLFLFVIPASSFSSGFEMSSNRKTLTSLELCIQSSLAPAHRNLPVLASLLSAEIKAMCHQAQLGCLLFPQSITSALECCCRLIRWGFSSQLTQYRNLAHRCA